MKPFLKAHWLYIIVAIVAVFLLWVLLRSCNPLPSDKKGAALTDSANAAHAKLQASLLSKIDTLIKANRKKDAEKDSLITEIHLKKQEVNIKGTQVKVLLAEREQLKKDRDTVGIVKNSDTLSDVVDAQQHIIGGYVDLTDSLIKREQESDRIKDSTIANYHELWHSSDATLGIVNGENQNLRAINRSAIRQLKFNKFLSRSEALVILAAIAKIVFIK